MGETGFVVDWRLAVSRCRTNIASANATCRTRTRVKYKMCNFTQQKSRLFAKLPTRGEKKNLKKIRSGRSTSTVVSKT